MSEDIKFANLETLSFPELMAKILTENERGLLPGPQLSKKVKDDISDKDRRLLEETCTLLYYYVQTWRVLTGGVPTTLCANDIPEAKPYFEIGSRLSRDNLVNLLELHDQKVSAILELAAKAGQQVVGHSPEAFPEKGAQTLHLFEKETEKFAYLAVPGETLFNLLKILQGNSFNEVQKRVRKIFCHPQSILRLDDKRIFKISFLAQTEEQRRSLEKDETQAAVLKEKIFSRLEIEEDRRIVEGINWSKLAGGEYRDFMKALIHPDEASQHRTLLKNENGFGSLGLSLKAYITRMDDLGRLGLDVQGSIESANNSRNSFENILLSMKAFHSLSKNVPKTMRRIDQIVEGAWKAWEDDLLPRLVEKEKRLQEGLLKTEAQNRSDRRKALYDKYNGDSKRAVNLSASDFTAAFFELEDPDPENENRLLKLSLLAQTYELMKCLCNDPTSVQEIAQEREDFWGLPKGRNAVYDCLLDLVSYCEKKAYENDELEWKKVRDASLETGRIAVRNYLKLVGHLCPKTADVVRRDLGIKTRGPSSKKPPVKKPPVKTSTRFSCKKFG